MHAMLVQRELTSEGPSRSPARRGRRSVTVNLAESPLSWLHARGHLSDRRFAAGERLRADWETAQLAPSITMRWDVLPICARGGARDLTPGERQIAAKARFDGAVGQAGPGLSDILWRVVCAGEGLPQAERALAWPARSGKLVLGLALDRVAISIASPDVASPRFSCDLSRMDNLTHSLIGAVLGQAGLKRKTGLAMPTLIIGANIPDIDASCTLFGVVSLAMRRGVTHGPIAMLVLPLLLATAMVAWDRWQDRRGKRPPDRLPVRPGWLLVLAYIGCLSHPLFDWMNSYGIRLLEPFSDRWFYGDALFIVDPWLLAMLIAGIWLSRRREKSVAPSWTRPARVAVAGMVAYLVANLGISALLANEARVSEPYAEIAVANPVPLTFWRREILWRARGQYGSTTVSLFGPKRETLPPRPIGMDDPRIAERVEHNAVARAFLFWSRMPVARRDGETIVISDQRFAGSLLAGDRFDIRLEP